MASNPASIPWAEAEEDWDAHREIITELYVNQRWRMKDVMRTMAEDYGFHATRRMYKTRFSKWGVAKNIKAIPKDAPEYVVSASGSSETNRQSKQPIAPTMTVQRIANHGSVHAPRHLWTRPAIQNIRSPDCYRFAEGTLYFTQVYISSIGFPSLGSSIADKRLITMAASAEWLNYVMTAKTLLAFGHVRGAVLLIDVCCHQYRSLLTSGDPSLVAFTVLAILKVLKYWSSLAVAFLKFICKMSGIVLGTAHPFSMLFHKFREAGVDHLVYCFGVTVQHFLGGIVHIIPHPMMESYGDHYSDMFQRKMLDTSTALSELHNLQRRLRHRLQGLPENQSEIVEDTAAMQCRIAWLHYYAGRYEDATEMIMGMLNEPEVDDRVIAGCYDILHDIAVAENKHNLALDMIQKAVETSVLAYGYAHSSTTRQMVRLESCLRSMGRLPEADKVHSSWEMQVTQICEKVQRMRL
ncbi:Clr5 domain-containing protein [Xylaria flabelliformis]|nr:Clr5 domain-containing protein [Xylaria flabelliformis]